MIDMNADVLRCYQGMLKKSQANLGDAKTRNDKKAVKNIERKIKILGYTLEMLKTR